MIVRPGGPRCECGKRGCLQAVSSGRAMGRRAAQMLEDGGRDSALGVLHADHVTGTRVGEAAREGDVLALTVIREAAESLGLALANAAHLVDPERIIVGGGVAELGPLLFEPMRHAYRTQVFGPLAETPIVQAELGYDAGVIGAAAVAMDGAGARCEP
jgi:glucokinase